MSPRGLVDVSKILLVHRLSKLSYKWLSNNLCSHGGPSLAPNASDLLPVMHKATHGIVSHGRVDGRMLVSTVSVYRLLDDNQQGTRRGVSVGKSTSALWGNIPVASRSTKSHSI